MYSLPYLALALLPLNVPASPIAEQIVNKPVPNLDLSKYSGQWHEIAHLPMFFQRRCVDQITATYTINTDGHVTVRNSCRTLNGKMEVAYGVAKSVDGQRGALKVRFAPHWLSWLPLVWADYWVVELDPHYQWAVVGSPSRKYLWVLSRSPSMPRALFDELLQRATARGYDISRLVMAAPLN